MRLKPLARFLYASIPGLAAVRFAAKDLAAPHFPKTEYYGVRHLSVGKGLIVDVGANRGQSIAAFKRMARDSTIIAFEPEPISVNRLVLRYHRDSGVTIHKCALGERVGTETIFIPTYGRWSCDGMAATSLDKATAWLRDPGRMLLYDEKKLNVKEYSIECRTLDSFELKPIVLKIHAQGAELQILRGSLRTVIEYKPALMCAFPAIEVTELLLGLGYRPYGFSNSEFQPGIAPAPVTFTWFLTDKHVGQLPIDT